MFVIHELETGKRLEVDQTVLLIYCRKFDDGFVIYEEIIKLQPLLSQPSMKLSLETNGVTTHQFECISEPHRQ